MPSNANTSSNELNLPLLSRRESIIAERQDGFGQLIGFAMTCLLSFLLYLQFSISLVDSEAQNFIQTKTVNISVCLFFMTSLIFRQTVQEAKIERAIIHLVPELIVLATIGLAYCNHAVLGFVVLLVGKLVMAAASVVYCAVQLMVQRPEQVEACQKTVDVATLV